MWIEKGLQVGKEITNLAAIEEALAANEVVADPGLAQGGFQGPGLGVGAEENGLIGPGNSPGQSIIVDQLDDGARFLFVVGEGVEGDLRAVAHARPEFLAAAADIVLDDGVGGLQGSWAWTGNSVRV